MAQLSITTTRTTTTTTISTTTTTTISTSTHYFSSLILPYLLASCSFVASNPLYFSYLVFFSPYILKILSFLSPLFLTTSLFLLAFVALHKDCLLKSSESKVGALLGCDLEEEDVLMFRVLEELEACMVALDSEARNNYYGFSDSPYKESALGLEDKAGEFGEDEAEEAITLKELSESPELASESHVGENPLINQPLSSDREQTATEQQPLIANNVKELKKIFEKRNEAEPKAIRQPLINYKERKTTEEPSIVSNDKENDVKDRKPTEQQSIVDNAKENKKNSETTPCSTNLTPCASMRKDKEWKRTLACKLYEERHNKYGSEGMDSLWEEYEADSGKVKKNGETVKKEYDEEDEEDDETDVKICCLQALKLSSGRMNMGMKKPSLLKISKALKGIGWLHSVGKLGKEKAK